MSGNANRPTKLHALLATDTWTDELRAEVIEYLYT